MGSVEQPVGPHNNSPDPVHPPSQERPQRYGWQNVSETGYTIDEVPSGQKKRLRIIAVGAGASGINLAKFADDQLENAELIIYEKNDEVGGTWTENRYPGCGCDIPSVTYQYTWEPNVWSKYYSDAPEILQYFKNIVHKYDLKRYIKLRHAVRNAAWDEDKGKWNLDITDLATATNLQEECDIFINCGGLLNFWQWPKDIKGIDCFKGIKAHTAAYPDDLDIKGKRVAVVGTGSSGIQLITKIQPDVEKLYTWIRSPTWTTSGFAQAHAGPNGANMLYTEELLNKFRNDPDWYLKYRKTIEMEMSDFIVFHKNTPGSIAAREFALNDMNQKLASRPDLRETLIPKTFPVGCRRPTPGNGYLEALISPNVSTFCGEGLTELTENGFLDTQGNEVEVDVIIFATGFNTTWVPRFPITANGKNLQDIYRQRAVSYLGVAAPHMPNYLTFHGPYGPAGAGSALPMIEFMSRYALQWIEKVQIERIKKFTPKLDVIQEYGDHADLWLKRMVWDGPCRSWMKGGTKDGKVMLYCGSRAQYMELISKPRFEDFDIQYISSNRWNWLGNGFTQRDVNGQDITWFWGIVDGIDKQRTYDI